MPVANTNRTPTISVAEAESIIQSHARILPVESCPLRESRGRVLREEVRADRDFPPFDRVTMDGIALSVGAVDRGRREFRIAGEQAAGDTPTTLPGEGDCIEVMTGAVLPAGCDGVVPVEEITCRDGRALIDPQARVTALQCVHRQGSDHRSGELLLSPGMLLESPQLAVCATVGKSEVTVSRRATVAVVSTGDELVDIDQTPAPHQIRVSNSYAVEGALTGCGHATAEIFHVPDRPEAIERLFAELLVRFEVLIVSGGVSAGRYDLVPPTLEKLGVRKLFHRVAQRPGFPLLFGVSARGTAVFGLPGNPVSSLVSTQRYVVPYLQTCSGIVKGGVPHAVLTERRTFEIPRTLFLPVRVEPQADGHILAHPLATNGSGDLGGLIGSDGFIELPAEQAEFEAGTSWPLYRWS